MKQAWRAVQLVWIIVIFNTLRFGFAPKSTLKPRGLDYAGMAFGLVILAVPFAVLYYVIQARREERRAQAIAGANSESAEVPTRDTSSAPPRATVLGRGALALSAASINPLMIVAAIFAAIAAFANALRDSTRNGGLIPAAISLPIAAAGIAVWWRVVADTSRPRCGVNMRKIYTALRVYQEKHAEYPDTLNALVAANLVEPKHVHCALSPDRGAPHPYSYFRPSGKWMDNHIYVWCDAGGHGAMLPVSAAKPVGALPRSEVAQITRIQSEVKAAADRVRRGELLDQPTVDRLKKAKRLNGLRCGDLLAINAIRLAEATLTEANDTYTECIDAASKTIGFEPAALTSLERIIASRAALQHCMDLQDSVLSISINYVEFVRDHVRAADVPEQDIDGLLSKHFATMDPDALYGVHEIEALMLTLIDERLELLEFAWGRWTILNDLVDFDEAEAADRYNEYAELLQNAASAQETLRGKIITK